MKKGLGSYGVLKKELQPHAVLIPFPVWSLHFSVSALYEFYIFVL